MFLKHARLLHMTNHTVTQPSLPKSTIEKAMNLEDMDEGDLKLSVDEELHTSQTQGSDVTTSSGGSTHHNVADDCNSIV